MKMVIPSPIDVASMLAPVADTTPDVIALQSAAICDIVYSVWLVVSVEVKIHSVRFLM